jgi:hypothetical protein
VNISPEERKMLNESLTSLMETSQRSLVSLRKNDFRNLSMDVEQLAISIATFIAQAGDDLLPGPGV